MSGFVHVTSLRAGFAALALVISPAAVRAANYEFLI